MRWSIEMLNPAMRAQAQRKIDQLRAVSTERTVICQDDKQIAAQMKAKPGKPKRKRGRPKKIGPEDRLGEMMALAGLKDYHPQFRWHPERKFRADFAFPDKRLLVEVQGAVYTNGAHTRGSGYQYDRRRNNEAVVRGWRMLEFTPADVKSGHALYVIERALGITKTEGTCSPSWREQKPQKLPSTRTPSSG